MAPGRAHDAVVDAGRPEDGRGRRGAPASRPRSGSSRSAGTGAGRRARRRAVMSRNATRRRHDIERTTARTRGRGRPRARGSSRPGASTTPPRRALLRGLAGRPGRLMRNTLKRQRSRGRGGSAIALGGGEGPEGAPGQERGAVQPVAFLRRPSEDRRRLQARDVPLEVALLVGEAEIIRTSQTTLAGLISSSA